MRSTPGYPSGAKKHGRFCSREGQKTGPLRLLPANLGAGILEPKAAPDSSDVATGTGGGRLTEVARHLAPPTTPGATGIVDGTLCHGTGFQRG